MYLITCIFFFFVDKRSARISSPFAHGRGNICAAPGEQVVGKYL